MASSIETSKFSSHFRSISLPSRSHPLTTTVEEHLSRALSHLRSPAEESLDGSLKLLDVCVYVREAFSQMKECVQELNPSFQRRKRGDSSFACEVEAYINSRKRLNKVITKYLRTLKKKGPNKDSHNEATLTILREAEEISLSRLVSSVKIAGSKTGGEETNEVQGLDAALLFLRSSKDINNQVGDLPKRLETLESSIQETEEDLECIFRCLVKLRVSLLNIINH
ncbi:uncharacterized protein LOC115669786 [Syzygium oleosum]|uniref:uncharacterized protein LOC115669786 n=1 Tax=Syzygium oleosum TaxID=219896 RepID=UPI0024BB68DD|nr:uncharacterized protein LOC115669786 [Syzygium oleosum]